MVQSLLVHLHRSCPLLEPFRPDRLPRPELQSRLLVRHRPPLLELGPGRPLFGIPAAVLRPRKLFKLRVKVKSLLIRPARPAARGKQMIATTFDFPFRISFVCAPPKSQPPSADPPGRSPPAFSHHSSETIHRNEPAHLRTSRLPVRCKLLPNPANAHGAIPAAVLHLRLVLRHVHLNLNRRRVTETPRLMCRLSDHLAHSLIRIALHKSEHKRLPR